MKHLRHSLTFAASVVILGIALALSNTTSKVHAEGSDDSHVEGTWRVVVSPVGGPKFNALATFSSGGTMVESSSGGGDDKGGQGVWKKMGDRKFAFTLEQFSYDPAGNFSGSFKAREVDEFDHNYNSYSGVGTIDFYDATGKLVATVCARTQATRMVVEPPACH
jgi:hypothetical protein